MQLKNKHPLWLRWLRRILMVLGVMFWLLVAGYIWLSMAVDWDEYDNPTVAEQSG